MKIRIPIAIAAGALLLTGAVGCREEGPAEKLGRQLDEAAEEAGAAIDEAAEKAKKELEDG